MSDRIITVSDAEGLASRQTDEITQVAFIHQRDIITNLCAIRGARITKVKSICYSKPFRQTVW